MVIDGIKSPNKKEKEPIPLFSRHKNVHVNVPIGNDAKNQYRYTIRNVKSINPKSFGDVSDDDNYSAFDQTHTYLASLLEYYECISKVYEKMEYVANDELIFEKSYNNRTLSALISDEERELLSEAIDTIKEKLYQMRIHKVNCFN